jgi:hypothetical protein
MNEVTKTSALMRFVGVSIIGVCLGAAGMALIMQCTPESKEEATDTTEQTSITPASSSAREARRADSLRKVQRAKVIQDSVPLVKFRRVVISSRERLDSIRRAYKVENYEAYRAFTTVNRKDLRFFKLGDTVLLPSAIHKDLRTYSIFPHYYPAADTIAKLVLVSNKFQCYACYEKGRLVRFAACNTGEEKKPTFPGRYAMNWRDKIRQSSLDSTWVLPWTWNIHLEAGSAFHEFEMPGRPVSHSCIRQFMDDAEWLFRWGKGAKIDTTGKKARYIAFTGTPVIIIDYFDFNRKKGGPWWDVSSNKDSTLTKELALPTAPMAVEEALIPISQIPQETRHKLDHKERYLYAEDTLRQRGVIRAEAVLEESVNHNKERREKAKAELAARLRAEKVEKAKAAKAAKTASEAMTEEEHNERAGAAEDEAIRATFTNAPNVPNNTSNAPKTPAPQTAQPPSKPKPQTAIASATLPTPSTAPPKLSYAQRILERKKAAMKAAQERAADREKKRK